MGVEATVIEGPPIKADQLLTKEHPDLCKGNGVCGMSPGCLWCLDFRPPGSLPWIIHNSPMRSVWERIEASIYQGGSVLFSPQFITMSPLRTTVDMVLDRDEKVFYVMCEKGYRKAACEIEQNPRICAVSFLLLWLAGVEQAMTIKNLCLL